MSTAALVAFLRCEADLSDERARRLRMQAEAMAEQFGVSGEMQQAYGKHFVARVVVPVSTVHALSLCSSHCHHAMD